MTSWKTTVLYGVNVNRTDLISHSPRKWRRLPVDLRWLRQFWDLADRLRKRGFKERVIEKILGLNFLNCCRSVWGS
jgi:microsomal dipeptidase-like Zn-dependent dipeptidase